MKLENDASEKWERSELQTQNLREKLVIFEALFKTVPCFQCSCNLQGIFIDDFSRDWQVYKYYLSGVFLNTAKFLGMDQITCKNCNKSSWMQVNKILLTSARPEQYLSFCTQFSMESNHDDMKPRFQSLSFS